MKIRKLEKMMSFGPDRIMAQEEARALASGRDSRGHTALIIAARAGNDFFVSQLLPFSKVNEKDIEGRTALMHAAIHCSPSTVMAIAKLADIEARDVYGCTALRHAVCHGNNGSIDALLNTSNPKSVDWSAKTMLMQAIEDGSFDIAMKLLPLSDLDARGPDGQTAMHYAAWAGNGALIRELIKAGADVELEDDADENALYAAVQANSFSAADMLLQYLNPDRKNTYRESPREEATRTGKAKALMAIHKYDAENDRVSLMAMLASAPANCNKPRRM